MPGIEEQGKYQLYKEVGERRDAPTAVDIAAEQPSIPKPEIADSKPAQTKPAAEADLDYDEHGVLKPRTLEQQKKDRDEDKWSRAKYWDKYKHEIAGTSEKLAKQAEADARLAEQIGEGYIPTERARPRPMILRSRQVESLRNALATLQQEFEKGLTTGEITSEMSAIDRQSERLQDILEPKRVQEPGSGSEDGDGYVEHSYIEVANAEEAKNVKRVFEYFDSHPSIKAPNYTELIDDVKEEFTGIEAFEREERRLKAEYDEFVDGVGAVLEAGDGSRMQMPTFDQLRLMEDFQTATGVPGREENNQKTDQYSEAAQFIEAAVKYEPLRVDITDRFESLASSIGDFGRAKTMAAELLGLYKSAKEIQPAKLADPLEESGSDSQAAK